MSALIKKKLLLDRILSLNLAYLKCCLSMNHMKYLPVSHEVLQKRFEPTKILQGVISMKQFKVTCIVHINDRYGLIISSTSFVA